MKLVELKEQLQIAPIIPTLTIAELDDAVPLAEALLLGGITVIEVTLRTPVALAAIEKIAKKVPEIIVGIGTVLNAEHYQQAINAGSEFIVSPGAIEAHYQIAKQYDTAFIPGVITPSEVMRAIAAGYDFLKYFPAAAMSGKQVLQAYAAVFPNINFCPTGGISASNAPDYLSLKNVHCIGGGWLTPKTILENKDWSAITALAKQSLQAIPNEQ